jgi:hypothetical protein
MAIENQGNPDDQTSEQTSIPADQSGDEMQGQATGGDDSQSRVKDQPADGGPDDEADLKSGQDIDQEQEQVIVSIGDETPEEHDFNAMPSWVKELRRAYDRSKRKNQELSKKIEQYASKHSNGNNLYPETMDPGPMPTLANSDYDEQKFSDRMTEWHQAKMIADQAKQKKKAQNEAIQKQFEEKINKFRAQKEQLKVRDFDDVEILVNDHLDDTQRGIIISASDNPAVLMYALGKNPKRLQELANIGDPIKFAFQAAKLEKDLKISKRQPKTAPEKTLSGTGNAIGAEKNLNHLRDEAAKSGDMQKVLAYRRKLREQARAG